MDLVGAPYGSLCAVMPIEGMCKTIVVLSADEQQLQRSMFVSYSSNGKVDKTWHNEA